MPAYLRIVRDERLIVVDEDVYPSLRRFRWYIPKSLPPTAQRPYTVLCQKTGKPNVRLARLITKAGPNEFPQHKNGDPLDCRRSNLRLVRNKPKAGWNKSPNELLAEEVSLWDFDQS